MDRSVKLKIAVGIIIFTVIVFLAAVIYLIPRIYNLSVNVDFDSSDTIYGNPLMGYAHRADEPEHAGTGTLVYIDLTWADWEPKAGKFDIKGFEERNHIAKWKGEGKHAVLRFLCDVPGDKSHMDIPQWVYEKTGDGTFYDTDYGMGYAPVYENDFFLEAHKKAITALGNYCNKDNFVAYVELGSLGHWGEWHTKYEDGVFPMPDVDTCWEYANQYADCFINARLLMRRNYVMAVDGQMGLYNDMTGHPEDTREWLKWMKDGGSYNPPGREIPYKPVDEIWNRAPVGGEFTSSIPMEQMLGTQLRQTLELIESSHMTFIGPKSPEGEQAAMPGAQEVLRRLGYRYRISRMEINLDYLKNSFHIKLFWKNDGVAPIYFNWPVMMYVYDENGDRRYWESVDIELQELIPGKTIQTQNEIPFNDLFRKGYTIGVGILDPETEEPVIELAMNKKFIDGINIIYSYDGEEGMVFYED